MIRLGPVGICIALISLASLQAVAEEKRNAAKRSPSSAATLGAFVGSASLSGAAHHWEMPFANPRTTDPRLLRRPASQPTDRRWSLFSKEETPAPMWRQIHYPNDYHWLKK